MAGLPYSLILFALVWTALLDARETCVPDNQKYQHFQSVSESAVKGDVVFKISIGGSDDLLELRSPFNKYFTFEPSTRNVVVNSTLDADIGFLESQSLEIFCTVKATGRVVKISLYLTIEDANDNAPTFTENIYNISIGETTDVTSVITSGIRATDADASPEYSTIYYNIIKGEYSDYFGLVDPLKADLTLLKPLDFESLQQFSFIIMALDYYPGTGSAVKFNSTCTVVISVKDEDDQYPVFTSSIYRGTIIGQTTVNSVVPITPQISAYDPDKTLNARVEYSFHGAVYTPARAHFRRLQEADVGQPASSDAVGQSGQFFEINPNSGEVTLVNRPTSNEIYLLLQATQSDNPARYGVTLLTIFVQGSNVNSPIFTRSRYDVFRAEGFPVGEVVVSVLALDKDPGTQMRYRLANASSAFSMDPATGDIRLQKAFSYSSQDRHELFVIASDGELTSSATVSIRVHSANVHPPRINNKELNVTAARRKGASVIAIDADDPEDPTAALSYKLLNHLELFTITSKGLILVIAEADSISKTSYQVAVVVSDGGQPSLDKVAIVVVDFPPLPTPVVSASVGGIDDMVPVALGLVVAILLVVVVVLVVWMLRNRLKDKEHLARIKKRPPSRDPRVLAFKQKSYGKKAGTHLDNVNFQVDDIDASTSVQENPLSATSKGSYFNFGQIHSDTETDIETDRNDIQIETSVEPYNQQRSNDDNIYNNSQYSVDSEDYQNMDKSALASLYRNGSLSTYRDSSGSDMSLTNSPTDSNDSKKGLVPGSLAFTELPEENIVFWSNGGGKLPSVSNHTDMDPNTSVQPLPQKQELTVYF